MLQEMIGSHQGVIVVSTESGDDRWLYFACKRCMDVILAVLLLLLLSPLLLLIAALVKLDSPGSVFFVQERIGSRRRKRGGQAVWEVDQFPCYKFRSMVQDADQSLHQNYIKAFVEGRLEATVEGKFKLTGDPRVTRVGRFLRKASLDELPQLLNVLKGEMSLVGPRPVPIYEVDEYQPQHYQRLAALPGITGFWQVKGRCEVTFEEMIAMDIEYIRRRSLLLDVKILFLTLPAVLSGRGAD